MSDNKLKKLQEAWKKLNEAEASYVDPQSNQVYGDSILKPTSKDYGKNEKVKAAYELPKRGEGAQGTDDEQKSGFEGSADKASDVVKGAQEVRDAGASAGAKEVVGKQGTDKAPEGSNVEPAVKHREGNQPGAAGAPKEYSQDFRTRIRDALGLPLNDKLNKTGEGLGKDS